MLIVWTVAVIAVESLGVFVAWYSAKDDEKSKAAQRAFFCAIFACVCNVVINLLAVELTTPACLVSVDYDGVYFDSQQYGTKIEYSLSTGDADEIEWITYHEGDIIPIERDPTTIRYRSYYFLKKGDIEKETAHIDPYGRVYTDIEPPITFTSIVADYKLRNAEPGKAGNVYTGYTLKAEDLDVRGIDPNNNQVPIDGFTFEPEKLSYGKNVINVLYITNTKQVLEDTVVIHANYPSLVSIDVSLNDEFNGKVLPGTILTPDMFKAEGTYEDGQITQLDTFDISPVELTTEGTYLVTVSRDGVSAETEVIATSQIPVSSREQESNNVLSSASRINVNTRYIGNLFDDSDVDYYRLQITNKGKVWVCFQHDKFDDSYPYWIVTLLRSQNDGNILSMTSSGSTAEEESSFVRIGPGTYYLKVENNYHSDLDYTFMVGYASEDDSFEEEPNDDYEMANVLDLDADRVYTGNLSHDKDYDYFKIVLPQKARVTVSLAHAKVDSNDSYWVVSVVDGVDDRTVAEMYAGGNSAVTTMDPFRLSDGTYYIRVKPYYWNDMDYELTIQCQWEDSDAESEQNDDFTSASPISLGTWIAGNIQNKDDQDFYSFMCDNTGSVSLTFNHERSDSGDVYWEIILFGDEPGAIATADDKQSLMVRGNDPDGMECSWTGLQAGCTYYLKVKPYYHNCSDYLFRVD